MTFLDTGILVGALLEKHPEHAACFKALNAFEKPFTDAHALAETNASLPVIRRTSPTPHRAWKSSFHRTGCLFRNPGIFQALDRLKAWIQKAHSLAAISA
jgi:predicted nucleic acid-binding protein